ncbi:MAG: hypothetical protein U1D30_24570 [Planctomycetota bacterium]
MVLRLEIGGLAFASSGIVVALYLIFLVASFDILTIIVRSAPFASIIDGTARAGVIPTNRVRVILAFFSFVPVVARTRINVLDPIIFIFFMFIFVRARVVTGARVV